MNEFQFWPDRTTDYGVSCPWASKKYPYRPYNGENGVSTFSLLFLIGSFWYFHVTRTSIKAWMSLNFLKWDLTLAHWTQVSDRCPLGYLFCLWLWLSGSCSKACKKPGICRTHSRPRVHLSTSMLHAELHLYLAHADIIPSEPFDWTILLWGCHFQFHRQHSHQGVSSKTVVKSTATTCSTSISF